MCNPRAEPNLTSLSRFDQNVVEVDKAVICSIYLKTLCLAVSEKKSSIFGRVYNTVICLHGKVLKTTSCE